MALLKKLRSATLIETLIATVLIVIVFMIASMVLNNLLLNSFSGNTRNIETRVTELEYSARYGKIALPYHEKYKDWEVQLKKENLEDNIWLQLKAVNTINRKEIIKCTLCTTQN